MPAETHQLGQPVGVDEVLALLCALLDVPDGGETATLAELGVDQSVLDDLWDAACEEYAERTLGPELEPDALDMAMNLESVAAAMTAALRSADAGEA